MLKVNVHIRARLKCPNHPRYNGNTAPRASCQPCQAIFNLAPKLRQAQGDINVLLAQAMAMGCVDSTEPITVSGSSAP